MLLKSRKCEGGSNKNENASRHVEKRENFIQKYFSKVYDNPDSDLGYKVSLLLDVILKF